MNSSAYKKMTYKKFAPLAGYKNKPNLVRPALFAKELPDWSNPIRQACVVCEGVAGLIKGQNHLP